MNITAALLTILVVSASTDQDYALGVQALKARQADVAIEHLQRAAQADQRCVDCRWELGWAYYLKADWTRVVLNWREVKALDPHHPEVDKHLPAAEAYLKAEQVAARSASSAPASAPADSGKVALHLQAVGDVMLGTTFPEGYLPPDDGAHSLDPIQN